MDSCSLVRPVSLAALSAGRSTFWGIPVLVDGLCFNAAVTGASRPRQNLWMFCLYADLFKLKKKKKFFVFLHLFFLSSFPFNIFRFFLAVTVSGQQRVFDFAFFWGKGSSAALEYRHSFCGRKSKCHSAYFFPLPE